MKEEFHDLIQAIKDAEANLIKLIKVAEEQNSSVLDEKLKNLNIYNPNEVIKYKTKLEEKEKLLQETEEYAKVGRWSYYFDTNEMFWSAETYKMFDFPDNYVGTLNEFYLSCIDEKSAERVNQERRRLRTSEEGMMMNHAIDTPKGNRKVLSLTSSPIFNDNREIIGVEGFAKDLTDEISGKKGLDNFFNLSNDLHCIVHKDRYFVKISPAWTKLLGYSEKEMLSHSFLDFIHPDDIGETKDVAEVLNTSGIVTTFENRYLTKSGEVVYLSWNSQVDKESNLSYCTARDITKTKLAQDLLLSDLSEKELLLREIHHRVKNNLQIITSLLSLQAGVNNEHDQLADLYEDSKNRIKSMAAIHEMFYQSKQLDKIEFGECLDKLIGDLSKSISSSQRSIDLNLDVEPIFVSLDTAIPLGLLMNEIVTNSIKHGADESGLVKVYVKVETLEDHRLKLTIGDHSVNRPKDILTQSGDSLGIMLINSLVEQIDGEITQLSNYEGTVYQLIFSTKK